MNYPSQSWKGSSGRQNILASAVTPSASRRDTGLGKPCTVSYWPVVPSIVCLHPGPKAGILKFPYQKSQFDLVGIYVCYSLHPQTLKKKLSLKIRGKLLSTKVTFWPCTAHLGFFYHRLRMGTANCPLIFITDT